MGTASMSFSVTQLDLKDMSPLYFFEEADELIYQAGKELEGMYNDDAEGALDMLAESLVRANTEDQFADTIDYVYGNQMSFNLSGKAKMIVGNLLNDLVDLLG